MAGIRDHYVVDRLICDTGSYWSMLPATVFLCSSPTHAGGLFAISRRWFADLGYYDPGLQIWGGENFELSFKVWQCGGRILNVPCSRVGHVYRNHMPYSFGNLKGPVISTVSDSAVGVPDGEYLRLCAPFSELQAGRRCVDGRVHRVLFPSRTFHALSRGRRSVEAESDSRKVELQVIRLVHERSSIRRHSTIPAAASERRLGRNEELGQRR